MPRNDAREKRFSNRVLEAFDKTGLPVALKVQNAVGDSPAEIMLYDEIGFWGVTASDFAAALAKAGNGPITLRINSPGGDVFDGYAIYNTLKAHGNVVNVVVDGLAASAASYIAMAGDTVTMAETSMMMIHRAAGVAIGNAQDMTDMAGVLDKIDGQIAAIYAAKSGETVEDMAALMDAETWFTAQEAKEAGLADEVIAPKKKPSAHAEPDLQANIGGGTAGAVENAAAADWMVGADRDLPMDDKAAWDGPAAAERMLDAAGFNGDNPDPDKAKRGFLVYDAANPKMKGSYKLPFADMIGGELKAVNGGIDAAASRLPQTDIPQDVRDRARAVLDAYEARSKNAADNAAKAAARLRRLRLADADNY